MPHAKQRRANAFPTFLFWCFVFISFPLCSGFASPAENCNPFFFSFFNFPRILLVRFIFRPPLLSKQSSVLSSLATLEAAWSPRCICPPQSRLVGVRTEQQWRRWRPAPNLQHSDKSSRSLLRSFSQTPFGNLPLFPFFFPSLLLQFCTIRLPESRLYLLGASRLYVVEPGYASPALRCGV